MPRVPDGSYLMWKCLNCMRWNEPFDISLGDYLNPFILPRALDAFLIP